MALNPKQRRFVEEYLVDLNATQAAIRAGYSAKTAYSIGQENINKPAISAAIQAAQAERSQRTTITADWVLRRLAEEAEADLAEIYEEDGNIKPVHEWPLIWRKGLIAGIEVEEIKSDGAVIGHIRKVKISERIKRIELIGKHVDIMAFRERVEHTGPNGGPVQTVTTQMTPQEAAEAYARTLTDG